MNKRKTGMECHHSGIGKKEAFPDDVILHHQETLFQK